MIRALLDRLGVGALAATGATLVALAVGGIAGLHDRIDAAARPVSSPRAPWDGTAAGAARHRDCPRERPAVRPTEL